MTYAKLFFILFLFKKCVYFYLTNLITIAYFLYIFHFIMYLYGLVDLLIIIYIDLRNAWISGHRSKKSSVGFFFQIKSLHLNPNRLVGKRRCLVEDEARSH